MEGCLEHDGNVGVLGENPNPAPMFALLGRKPNPVHHNHQNVFRAFGQGPYNPSGQSNAAGMTFQIRIKTEKTFDKNPPLFLFACRA